MLDIEIGCLEIWKEDLRVNASRAGLSGAVIAWITSPGFCVATRARLENPPTHQEEE